MNNNQVNWVLSVESVKDYLFRTAFDHVHFFHLVKTLLFRLAVVSLTETLNSAGPVRGTPHNIAVSLELVLFTLTI